MNYFPSFSFPPSSFSPRLFSVALADCFFPSSHSLSYFLLFITFPSSDYRSINHTPSNFFSVYVLSVCLYFFISNSLSFTLNFSIFHFVRGAAVGKYFKPIIVTPACTHIQFSSTVVWIGCIVKSSSQTVSEQRKIPESLYACNVHPLSLRTVTLISLKPRRYHHNADRQADTLTHTMHPLYRN